MSSERVVPFCLSCQSPKEKIGKKVGGVQIWFCLHCDTSKNCTGHATCGACKLGRERNFPGLPDVTNLGGA